MNLFMDGLSVSPQKSARLKDEFVQEMERRILAGEWRPGERLPAERELAKHYGVSRPVIHEGILILESRGLVTLRPRHGVVVNDYRVHGTLDLLLSLLQKGGQSLSPLQARDLESFRIAIEREIVTLICQGQPKSRLPRTKVLQKINQQMAESTSPAQAAERDFDFHLAMALSCQNAMYPLLFNTLKPAHMNLLGQFYAIDGVRQRAVEFHKELIKALEQGHAAQAIAVIERADSYSAYGISESQLPLKGDGPPVQGTH